MSGFDPEWLALREAHDRAARGAGLADRFAAALPPGPHLIDLGCGTGSNVRYLAPRIRGPQRWLCIDHDAALLAGARTTLRDWAAARGWPPRREGEGLILARPGGAIAIRFALADLARDPLPENPEIDGVTGAALLDLASARWLTDLASWSSQVPVLMALSFDGRLAFEPETPADRTIRERFVAHQRTDKGFGPALGPDAAPHLAKALAARACEVALARADWSLGPADGPLLAATLAEIVDAAGEIADDPALRDWARLRRRQLAAGDLRLTVGHLDLLALPG